MVHELFAKVLDILLFLLHWQLLDVVQSLAVVTLVLYLDMDIPDRVGILTYLRNRR